jgi:hypothetical protein
VGYRSYEKGANQSTGRGKKMIPEINIDEILQLIQRLYPNTERQNVEDDLEKVIAFCKEHANMWVESDYFIAYRGIWYHAGPPEWHTRIILKIFDINLKELVDESDSKNKTD